MEAVAVASASTEYRERRFFLFMAIAIALTVIVAFSLFLAAGISSFGSPWWVHVHAVTFMAWIGFYVLQNTLVFRNDIALHRRLGPIGAGYAVWMVLVGLVLTPLTLAVGRSPPFFTPAYFLALDWINILAFGGLFYAAHCQPQADRLASTADALCHRLCDCAGPGAADCPGGFSDDRSAGCGHFAGLHLRRDAV